MWTISKTAKLAEDESQAPTSYLNIMASFDDYLREGRLLDDYNKATLSEKQEVYNNWLKLNNPQTAPGDIHLRWQIIL